MCRDKHSQQQFRKIQGLAGITPHESLDSKMKTTLAHP